jgi:hypothetical protein
MGFVEVVLNHVSVTSVLLFFPGVFLVLLVYKLLVVARENFRLARRGPRAPKVPAKLPFGMFG